MTANTSLVLALREEGVSATTTTIASLADTALRIGVHPAVVSLLADASEPMCARVRAFGFVSARVYAATDEVFGTPVDPADLDLAA